MRAFLLAEMIDKMPPEIPQEKKKSPKDKYILFAFLAFFGIIFSVDAFFIYKAITTQTGVVSERAYEKGLHYNQILQEAEKQPLIEDKVIFENGVLGWDLRNLEDADEKSAEVTARIIRPIQEGYDFDVTLENKGNNIYQAQIDLPFKGLWEAKLERKWNGKEGWQTYKTTYQFIVK